MATEEDAGHEEVGGPAGPGSWAVYDEHGAASARSGKVGRSSSGSTRARSSWASVVEVRHMRVTEDIKLRGRSS